MRIVLDTNVLVSGLLSPWGPPAQILGMVTSGEVTLCVDARVLSEYASVLSRDRFAFDHDAVAALLDFIASNSDTAASVPLSTQLPDPDDEVFLEIALACRAECLVTGNLAHFPQASWQGMSVMGPTEFVDKWRHRGNT
jgi:putative PIN family toxin of toxin-antitoxin system